MKPNPSPDPPKKRTGPRKYTLAIDEMFRIKKEGPDEDPIGFTSTLGMDYDGLAPCKHDDRPPCKDWRTISAALKIVGVTRIPTPYSFS